MEPEIREAWRRAGLKLAVGAAVIAAAIGIRSLTVTPDERAGGLEGGSQAGARPATEAGDPGDPEALDPTPLERDREDSLRSRLGTLGRSVQQSLTGSESKPREGDRIVSCRLPGVRQFMRADDCVLRGGRLREGER